jgi:spermidine synthase
VIEVSKEWLGSIHRGALDDPRVDIRIGDGFEFVKSTSELFDLIVLDLTDPDTPAFRLYTEEFFRLCQRALKPGGILTLHLGSPVYQADTVRKNAASLRRVFRHVTPMTLFVPLYGSLWCLGISSDSVDARTIATDTIAQRLADRGIDDLRYYNAGLHAALFALPTFVQDLTQPNAQTQSPRIAHLKAA